MSTKNIPNNNGYVNVYSTLLGDVAFCNYETFKDATGKVIDSKPYNHIIVKGLSAIRNIAPFAKWNKTQVPENVWNEIYSKEISPPEAKGKFIRQEFICGHIFVAKSDTEADAIVTNHRAYAVTDRFTDAILNSRAKLSNRGNMGVQTATIENGAI